METISSDTLTIKLFTQFGITKRVSLPILSKVKVWVSSMGLEETVSRLKTLKAFYLTGIVPTSATWIALNADGHPKGVFRPLWRFATMRQAVSILDIYTNFISGKLTQAQWTKFISSVESEAGPTVEEFENDDRFHFRSLKKFKRIIPKLWRKSKYDNLNDWTNSPTKRVYGFDPVSRRYYYQIESLLPYDFHIGNLSHLIITDESMKSLFYECLGTSVVFHEPRVFPRSPVPPRVGSLAIIQEKGMKARIVANPHRVHQLVLSKLGNFLHSFLRYLPWDCTYDQEEGIRFVTEALQLGKCVHCYDLTDATNVFPLGLQMYLLKEVLNCMPEGDDFADHIRLFEFLSRGVWLTPKEAKKFTRAMFVRWSRGQPLGLMPSFSLFALTHGFVIHEIECAFNTSNTFRVLGDDIVISDPRVANAYVEMLGVLKVPISVNKTIVSSVIGEFAGKIITKDGPLKVSKWKIWSKKDIFSVYEWLGLRGEILVPRPYRKMMREIASIPEPIGLGLNPKGLTFDQRLDKFQLLVDNLFAPDLLSYSHERERKERRRDAYLAFKSGRLPLTETPLPIRTEEVDQVEVQHLNQVLKDDNLRVINSTVLARIETLRGQLSGKQRGWKTLMTALARFIPFFR